MDEKLYRHLQAEQTQMERDIFAAPPKTIEEFTLRLGQWQQLTATLRHMVDSAKKDPDE